jgi:hypothetical protein
MVRFCGSSHSRGRIILRRAELERKGSDNEARGEGEGRERMKEKC